MNAPRGRMIDFLPASLTLSDGQDKNAGIRMTHIIRMPVVSFHAMMGLHSALLPALATYLPMISSAALTISTH